MKTKQILALTGCLSLAIGVYAEDVPTELTATKENNNVRLEWIAPTEAPSAPVDPTVVDSFEDYEPWTYKDVGDWKFVDEDGVDINGIAGVEIPNRKLYKKAAFILFDNTHNYLSSIKDKLEAVSGSKFLGAFCVSGYGPTDDWMISPLLSGREQTISFWARSYDGNFPEKFAVWYSTENRELTNFQKIESSEDSAVPTAWTKYEVTLPEGARYFAINSVAGGFLFMVDEVTYQPAQALLVRRDEAASFGPAGYNIYRNEVQINASPIPETTYLDTNVPSGELSYRVTAVWESAKSNEAKLSVSSAVESQLASDSEGQVSIESDGIRLNSENRAAYFVCDEAGRVLYEGTVSGSLHLPLSNGIYCLYLNGKSHKIIIR